LFIDAVGSSKLLLDEQRTLIERLNQLVRSTAEFRSAEAAGKFSKLPPATEWRLFFTTELKRRRNARCLLGRLPAFPH
jgi:hypothetical protein